MRKLIKIYITLWPTNCNQVWPKSQPPIYKKCNYDHCKSWALIFLHQSIFHCYWGKKYRNGGRLSSSTMNPLLFTNWSSSALGWHFSWRIGARRQWGGESLDESELVGKVSPLSTNGHRQLRDTVGKGPTNINGVPQTSPNVFHGGQSFNGADGNLWSSAKVCLHATTSTRARRRLTVEDGLLRRNTAFLPRLLPWAYAVSVVVKDRGRTSNYTCRRCCRHLDPNPQ